MNDLDRIKAHIERTLKFMPDLLDVPENMETPAAGYCRGYKDALRKNKTDLKIIIDMIDTLNEKVDVKKLVIPGCYKDMPEAEYYDACREMTESLELLAKDEGCLAAAWALELLAYYGEKVEQ